MSEFDVLLYRPIRPGKEYDTLIPKTRCKSSFAGEGMTEHSIAQMEKVIRTYSWQMAEMANFLKTGSLEGDVAAIKDFIYWHFQYMADGDDQMLRTPACSWHCRAEGIDCKSYSILASCLLREMGIAHCIRRIKQPGYRPDQWSHVYVIVPTDQKTHKLKKGYYTLDGTLEDDDEPDHLEKSDLAMMDHYVLNGAYGRANGLNATVFGYDIRNFSDIKTLIGHIDCLGGSSFTANDLSVVLTNIQKYYTDLIGRINDAAHAGNPQAFADAVCEFYGNSKLFWQAAQGNRNKDWNSCTDGRIAVMMTAFKWYRDIMGQGLTAWLTQYFVKGAASGSVTFSNEGIEAKFGFRHTNTTPWTKVNETRFLYTTNPSINEIKAFEVTPYAASTSVNSAGQFNPATFLSGLSTILASFNPGSTGTGTGGGTIDGEIDLDDDGLPKTSRAGSGTLGWIIAGVGATLLFTAAQKDKPLKKTNDKN